jgi:hypothetical protein
MKTADGAPWKRGGSPRERTARWWSRKSTGVERHKEDEMRSQKALRPGVAVLAAALLALAWIPAAAAPPAPTVVPVNATLPAVYPLDNPCTTAHEAITLQGSFTITGSVTIYASGTKDLDVDIHAVLSGTDSVFGGTYTTDWTTHAGFGRFGAKTPLTGTSSSKVYPPAGSSLPSFWLKVRFYIYNNGTVIFSWTDSNGQLTDYGYDGVLCGV